MVTDCEVCTVFPSGTTGAADVGASCAQIPPINKLNTNGRNTFMVADLILKGTV
jgi:hypothetical protein